MHVEIIRRVLIVPADRGRCLSINLLVVKKMNRSNRHIRLTKRERDEKYINKTWPVQKPIKDADVWKSILTEKKEKE